MGAVECPDSEHRVKHGLRVPVKEAISPCIRWALPVRLHGVTHPDKRGGVTRCSLRQPKRHEVQSLPTQFDETGQTGSDWIPESRWHLLILVILGIRLDP